MAGLKTTSSTHFEAVYEAPWGGVASNAPAFDIAPGQLVQADGVTIRDGVLCSSNIVSRGDLTLPAAQANAGAFICLIFNGNANTTCAVDQLGNSYVLTAALITGKLVFQLDQVAENASANFGIPDAVKVVDNVAYISVYSTNTLYAYIPGASYLIATTYAAGKYLDIFGEYLIQLNTNSANKDAGDGEQPSRINWCGPDKFTTWDPSLDRTAGYQSITDSANYITGFVAVDNVGYIFRREGITQITQTGVAIQPFNYTTYWNGVGQGLLFGRTLSQYGREVFLATDSNIYQFVGGGYQPIGDVAKNKIFSNIGQIVAPDLYLAGGMSIFALEEQAPAAEYFFCYQNTGNNENLYFWIYNLANKSWSSITKTLPQLGLVNAIVNFIRVSTVFLNDGRNIFKPVLLFMVNVGNPATTYIYYNIVNTPTVNQLPITQTLGALTLVFKQEQVKMGRQPNIRRVVVFACGVGDLFVSVNGEIFTTITLDGTNTYRVYYSDGIITEELPQCTITSQNFNGRIAKVMMIGSYGDGELD